MIEDLHLGNDASLIDHQVAQKLELGGGKIDRHTGAGHFVSVLIDDEVCDAELAIIAAFAEGATQNCANARNNFFEAEGLGDVVVAADREALDLVTHIVASGQEQNRDGDSSVAQAAGHGETVHVGKHDVQDDQVRAFFLRLVVCRGAVFCRNDIETCKSQRRGQKISDIGFIVNDEKSCFSIVLKFRHSEHFE